MALLVQLFSEKYHYVFTELADPRQQHLLLMSSPVPLVVLVAGYVWLVTSLGPRLMRDRAPFKLDRLMQAYNVLQIVLSLVNVERAITLGWNFSHYRWVCEPVDYSDHPLAVAAARATYFYFLTKIVDLLDTVFFVLRKKNTQNSFLHVYHHAVVLMGIWIGAKYVPGGHITFMGLINSVVHVVMYSYYLLTSLCPEQKANVWWKKHITQMQMVQFALVGAHDLHMLLKDECAFPKAFALLTLPQAAFMLALFGDFYHRAYVTKKTN